MDLQKLKPGDLFLTREVNPDFVSKGILWFTKLGSIDYNAYYSHAGIIIDEAGNTFESTWPKIGSYNLWQKKGHEILIARHKLMTSERFERGLAKVKEDEGKIYPVWRFAAYITRTEKIIHWSVPVCAELVAKFLHYSIEGSELDFVRTNSTFKNRKTGKETKDWIHYWGVTPDNLFDCYRKWTADFDIIGNQVI